MAANYKDIMGDIKNQSDIYAYYFTTFYELAINRFKWENLPTEIDPRYLEMSLCNSGGVIWFFDELLGYAALQCAWTGFDNYYNPTDFDVITPTGFSAHVDKEEGVMIWNNFMRVADIPFIHMFAKNISDVYESAMVNCKSQKHPVAIYAESEKEKLSLENAYMKVEGNHPIIYVKGKNMIDRFGTIDTKAPFVAPELFNIKDKMMEEFLKWLGVKIPLINGRERLLDAEQQDANAVTFQLRNRGLHAREVAAEEINRRFGLNLRVSFNEDLASLVTESGVME